MTTEELNSYRLTSLDEPTDEMLQQIMKEVAEDVKAENEALQKNVSDKSNADDEDPEKDEQKWRVSNTNLF